MFSSARSLSSVSSSRVADLLLSAPHDLELEVRVVVPEPIIREPVEPATVVNHEVTAVEVKVTSIELRCGQDDLNCCLVRAHLHSPLAEGREVHVGVDAARADEDCAAT